LARNANENFSPQRGEFDSPSAISTRDFRHQEAGTAPEKVLTRTFYRKTADSARLASPQREVLATGRHKKLGEEYRRKPPAIRWWIRLAGHRTSKRFLPQGGASGARRSCTVPSYRPPIGHGPSIERHRRYHANHLSLLRDPAPLRAGSQVSWFLLREPTSPREESPAPPPWLPSPRGAGGGGD